MQTFRAKILTATFVLLALMVVGENTMDLTVKKDLNLAAVIGDNPGSSGTIGDNPGSSGTIGDNPGATGSGRLTNPLKSDSITAFFTSILDVILTFAIPIVVLFIMYAGFLYVTARGEESKIKTAHAALTWAIVGGVIVLGAKLIINVIQGTVQAL